MRSDLANLMSLDLKECLRERLLDCLEKEPWSDAFEKDRRCRSAPLEYMFPHSYFP